MDATPKGPWSFEHFSQRSFLKKKLNVLQVFFNVTKKDHAFSRTVDGASLWGKIKASVSLNRCNKWKFQNFSTTVVSVSTQWRNQNICLLALMQLVEIPRTFDQISQRFLLVKKIVCLPSSTKQVKGLSSFDQRSQRSTLVKKTIAWLYRCTC